MSDDISSLMEDIPPNLRNLRACLQCHLIMNTKQWSNKGCPNCGWESGYLSRTSPVFKGVLSMMQPQTSWVARWQKQENYYPGFYAMQVVGKRTSQAND